MRQAIAIDNASYPVIYTEHNCTTDTNKTNIQTCESQTTNTVLTNIETLSSVVLLLPVTRLIPDYHDDLRQVIIEYRVTRAGLLPCQ